jgi:hypothetical protein
MNRIDRWAARWDSLRTCLALSVADGARESAGVVSDLDAPNTATGRRTRLVLIARCVAIDLPTVRRYDVADRAVRHWRRTMRRT